jgi:hypothetical protein
MTERLSVGARGVRVAGLLDLRLTDLSARGGWRHMTPTPSAREQLVQLVVG